MVEAVHHCIELSFIVLVGVLFNLSPWHILNHEQHVFIESQIRVLLLRKLLDTPAVVKDSDVIHIDNQQSVIDPPGFGQKQFVLTRSVRSRCNFIATVFLARSFRKQTSLSAHLSASLTEASNSPVLSSATIMPLRFQS